MEEVNVRIHKFYEESDRSMYGTFYIESIDINLEIHDSGEVKIIQKQDCTQEILEEDEEGVPPTIGEPNIDLESLIEFDNIITEKEDSQKPEIVIAHYLHRLPELPLLIAIRGEPHEAIFQYLNSIKADSY